MAGIGGDHARRRGSTATPQGRRAITARWAAALLLLAATGCAAPDEPTPEPAKPPLIISSDMAMGLNTGNANGMQSGPSDIDDAYAYALVHAADTFDIRGLVLTMGNNQVRAEKPIAERTLQQLGSDAPVVVGADVWLPLKPTAEFDGDQPPDTCLNEGVGFMAEQLRDTADVTVLAIGPLTDLACLALNHPDTVGNIGRVVALVGSAPQSPMTFDGTTMRDFNFLMDPRAEQVILEQTDIPFTAITFEASSSAAAPTSRILQLRRSTSERARFFGEASVDYVQSWEKSIGTEKPMWDAAAAWYLLRPEAFICAEGGFDLALGETPSGGLVNTAAAPLEGVELHDWFSPDYTRTRRVTACTGFVSDDAEQVYLDSVFAALGA